MAFEHAIDVEVVDDDDFEPPTPVRVEAGTVLASDCPTCGRPLRRHTSLELLRCSEAPRGEPVEVSGEPGRQAAEVCPLCGGEGTHRAGCKANVAADEYAAWAAKRAESRRAATAAEDWRKERERQGLRVPRSHAPPVVEVEAIAPAVTADDVRDASNGMPNIIPLPDGGIDYEALAAAMRVVIERERDEVVKRGGPLEKQNQELKERVAALLDEAALWRKRANAAIAARNSFEEQYNALVKENRKARAKGDRSGASHASVTNVADIIRVVEHTKGFEVRKQGNGHFGIYKDGVYVTDMASSPGQERANMATRVKLRKAGVNV